MLHFPHRAGNYVLFAELGSGTVGTTYIGRQAGYTRAAFKPLVVRLLAPHLSQRPDIVRVFLDEQRAAALLQHPRIAAVQEVGVMPDGAYFLACEYVHGVPLREVQRTPQAQLTPAQAVHLAMQICDAAHYAHERLDVTGKPLGIVHGQLSPDAVLVGFDGNVKVTEFGLLRTRDAATATIPTMLQRRTAFLSPELRGQMPLRSAPHLDRRTDVYSIGAILWEMVTGEALVPTDDGSPPPPASQVRPLDPQLDAIIARAMARSPSDRFASAQALRLALTGVAASLGIEGSVATGLARSLTVTFRDRIVAFQEQVDLWRKYEDEVLDSSEMPRYNSGASGLRATMSGGRSGPPFGAASGSAPGLISGSSFNQSHSGHSGAGPRITHPSGNTPAPPVTPLPGPVTAGDALRGRLFLILLLLAIFGIVAGGGVLLLRPRQQTGAAVLLIDSQPRGAQIRLDGRRAGTTPFRIADVRAPSVRVEVLKEGFRTWSRDITLQPGKTVPIDAELEPELR